MAVLAYIAVILGLIARSDATYCECKVGVNETLLQKTLDYACGAGADCTAILQNGACYQPNTVKDHCSYAVNSYFQKKGQASGSCDFAGTATTVETLTDTVASGCVYPSSPSTAATPSPGTTNSTVTPSSPTSSSTTPSIFGVSPSTTTPTTTSINGAGLTKSTSFLSSLALSLCLSALLLLCR